MPSTTPRSVVKRFTLVPKPPREWPSACLGGSSSCAGLGPPRLGTTSGFFFRPAGGAAGAKDGGIDEPQFVAQAALTLKVFQQMGEDPSPSAVFPPRSEAAVASFPGAVTLGDVAPGGAGVETPEDAIEDAVLILPATATTVFVRRVREERGDALPLLLREFRATRHRWPLRRTSTLRTGRSGLMEAGTICQTVPSRGASRRSCARCSSRPTRQWRRAPRPART